MPDEDNNFGSSYVKILEMTSRANQLAVIGLKRTGARESCQARDVNQFHFWNQAKSEPHTLRFSIWVLKSEYCTIITK